MASHGGARNRSGPPAQEGSARSDQRGYTLTALPSEGYSEPAPEFPLQPIVLFTEYFEGSGKDRVKVKECDESETRSFRDREADVWAEAWRTPQACAWSMESWRWPVVAEYCRLKTVMEFDPSASAALVGQIHRYRDQLGLTPAGMKDNGWKIAVDEVGARAAERQATPPTADEDDEVAARRRAISGGA